MLNLNDSDYVPDDRGPGPDIPEPRPRERSSRERRPGRRSGGGPPRLPALTAVVVGAVVIVALLFFVFGGDAEDEPEEGQESGGAEPFEAEDQTVGLGEAAALGEVTVTVTALTATDQPVRPDRGLDAGTAGTLGEGSTFFQAFAYISNRGDEPVRVDPRHFSLVADGRALELVPRETGPPARTLLPGASLDLILTFAGPEGQEPRLVYRPPWASATVEVEGMRAPAGMRRNGDAETDGS